MFGKFHHSDIIMSAVASQITGVSIVLNRLFRRRSKKTAKIRVTGLCEGIHRWSVDSPTKASNAENVSYGDVIMQQIKAKNACHLADDVFKCIFVKKVYGLSLKFGIKRPIEKLIMGGKPT